MSGDVVHDGNVYLSNYRTWFSGCFHNNNKPHFTKTNILRPKHAWKWRIKDSLIYESCATDLNDVKGVECGCYSESLFLLTSTSHLVRYRIIQNRLVQQEHVYLGARYKFEHLSYDRIFDRIILKSQSHGTGSDMVFYIAVFRAAPFAFVGLLGVSRRRFGRVLNCFVFNGMLTVLTAPNIYSLYDFDYILKNFITRDCALGEVLTTEETREIYNNNDNDRNATVGDFPFGLPVNINMERTPHHEYHVYSCCAENLDFGGFPWQSLSSTDRNGSNSSLYDVGSGRLLATINDTSFDYQMKLVFHPDGSGRLLKKNHDGIM